MIDRKRTDSCRDALRLVHEELDRRELSPASARARDEHLGDCPDCAAAAGELERICGTLRTLPATALPSRALDRVLGATVERRTPAARQIAWRGLSAAAASLLIAFVALSLHDAAPPAARDADVIAAAGDIRLAFALAAREIDRSENVALEKIVRERFAPALARVPIFKRVEEDGR